MTAAVDTAAPAAAKDETIERLWAALHDVEDPEFPMSIVDMGLVFDVQKLGACAKVKMTFTAMGCPCMDMIIEDIRARLQQEPDIDEVEVEIVWSPVWTKARLTERGREIMLLNGVTV